VTFCLDARTAHDHFPGVGRYVANLARAMATGLAEDEAIVLLRDPTHAPWNIGVDHPRVRLVDAAVSPFALQQQWQLPRLLRRIGARLYHSPYYLMPLRAGVPTVVTIHDLIPLRFPTYFSRRDRLIFAAAVRLALRVARVVIAVSATTARDLTDRLHVAAARIAVIPEAADPVFRPQAGEVVTAMRTRWSLPERYVLYFGSNKPHKNLVALVDAWAQLQPQPMPLVIAGVWDPRYPEACQRAETKQLTGAIRFLGPVTEADLPALYSGALVFVFPSEYEGFGLPVIEAMACGVPVACSNTPSLIEVAGDAANWFDPHDADSIASTVGALVRDGELRHDLSKRGIERAARFAWTDTARATLDVYRSLL